jgi:signal transduction histidine kinase
MVIMGTLISVPLLTLGGWEYRTDMMRNQMQMHEQAATGMAVKNASAFETMIAPAQVIVDLAANENMAIPDLKRAVDFIVTSNQHLLDVIIVDENGSVITGSDPMNRSTGFARFAGLENLRAGKSYKSGIVIDEEYKYILELAWPFTRAHIYAGFVFARVDFSRLWGGLDEAGMSPQSNIMLVDRASGRVMADRSRAKLGTIYTPRAGYGQRVKKAQAESSGAPWENMTTWEEAGKLLSRFEIKEWPVDVVMESKTETLATHMADNFRFVLMAALAWMSVGLVVSYFVATMITEPLRKLAEFMVGIPEHRDLRAKSYGGEYNIISASLNTMLDSIQRKEKQLQEQSAVAAVGRMATVLAHDIRNGLHNIMNAAALFDTKPDFARDIIRRSADKMIDQLNNIMEFARSGTPDIGAFSVETLFASFDASLMVEERFNGRVVKVVPGDPGMTVMVDRSKMVMVFDNLTRNALEAGARNVTLTWEIDGKWAVFVVRDDGPGIPKELREKVFDPFFSTKRNGFGIGLSIIEMVVKSHRGGVELVDAEGGGAEFRISAPLVAASPVKR